MAKYEPPVTTPGPRGGALLPPAPGGRPKPPPPPKPGGTLKPVTSTIAAPEAIETKARKKKADEELTFSDVTSALKKTPGVMGQLALAAPGTMLGLLGGLTKPIIGTDEDANALEKAIGRTGALIGFNQTAKILAEGVSNTVRLKNVDLAAQALKAGESPLPYVLEDVGNIALVFGGAGAALKGTGAAAGSAGSRAALRTAGDKLLGAARIADNISDAPITLPAYGIGKGVNYGGRFGRAFGSKQRIKADLQEAVNPRDPNISKLRARADKIDDFFGKEIFVDGVARTVTRKAMNRFTSRVLRSTNAAYDAVARAVPNIVEQALYRDEINPATGEVYGPLSAAEQQAVIAVLNGRARLISELMPRLDKTAGEVADLGRYTYAPGAGLTAEGAQLAVDFLNRNVDEVTYNRLTRATELLSRELEATTQLAREGRGRRSPLEPMYDIPLPEPVRFSRRLRAEGSIAAADALDDLLEQGFFDDLLAGNFDSPAAQDALTQLQLFLEQAPQRVALDPAIYPPKERNNVAFYGRIRKALEAQAAATAGGTPPGPGYPGGRPTPLDETAATGVPPENFYTDINAPGAFSRLPERYLRNSIKQLERLRGRARQIGEKIVQIEMSIRSLEFKIIKASLRIESLEGYYIDADGNRVIPDEDGTYPPGAEFQPGLIAKLIERRDQARAELERMRAEQAQTTVIDGKVHSVEQVEQIVVEAEQAVEAVDAAIAELEAEVEATTDEMATLETAQADAANALEDLGENPDALLEAAATDADSVPTDPEALLAPDDGTAALEAAQADVEAAAAARKAAIEVENEARAKVQELQTRLRNERAGQAAVAEPQPAQVSGLTPDNIIAALDDAVEAGQITKTQAAASRAALDLTFELPKGRDAAKANAEAINDSYQRKLFVFSLYNKRYFSDGYVVGELDLASPLNAAFRQDGVYVSPWGEFAPKTETNAQGNKFITADINGDTYTIERIQTGLNKKGQPTYEYKLSGPNVSWKSTFKTVAQAKDAAPKAMTGQELPNLQNVIDSAAAQTRIEPAEFAGVAPVDGDRVIIFTYSDGATARFLESNLAKVMADGDTLHFNRPEYPALIRRNGEFRAVVMPLRSEATPMSVADVIEKMVNDPESPLALPPWVLARLPEAPKLAAPQPKTPTVTPEEVEAARIAWNETQAAVAVANDAYIAAQKQLREVRAAAPAARLAPPEGTTAARRQQHDEDRRRLGELEVAAEAAMAKREDAFAAAAQAKRDNDPNQAALAAAFNEAKAEFDAIDAERSALNGELWLRESREPWLRSNGGPDDPTRAIRPGEPDTTPSARLTPPQAAAPAFGSYEDAQFHMLRTHDDAGLYDLDEQTLDLIDEKRNLVALFREYYAPIERYQKTLEYDRGIVVGEIGEFLDKSSRTPETAPLKANLAKARALEPRLVELEQEIINRTTQPAEPRFAPPPTAAAEAEVATPNTVIRQASGRSIRLAEQQVAANRQLRQATTARRDAKKAGADPDTLRALEEDVAAARLAADDVRKQRIANRDEAVAAAIASVDETVIRIAQTVEALDPQDPLGRAYYEGALQLAIDERRNVLQAVRDAYVKLDEAADDYAKVIAQGAAPSGARASQLKRSVTMAEEMVDRALSAVREQNVAIGVNLGKLADFDGVSRADLAADLSTSLEARLAAPPPPEIISTSAATEADWQKQSDGTYTINTGSRRYAALKVDVTPPGAKKPRTTWALKRYGSDGEIIEGATQVFPNFKAARDYVQQQMDADGLDTGDRYVYRPGRELGPGPGVEVPVSLLAAEQRLQRAEAAVGSAEQRLQNLRTQIEKNTARIDKLRIDEAAQRAKLAPMTAAAVRTEARLAPEIFTQPEVTQFAGQPRGVPMVGRALTPEGAPVMAGEGLPAMLRPTGVSIRRVDGQIREVNAAEAERGVPVEQRTREVEIVEKAVNEALLARRRSLPAALPARVALAAPRELGEPFIGSQYVPVGRRPGATGRPRRTVEQGLTGDVALRSEKLRKGTGEEIYDIVELGRILANERRQMELNEGFRVLLNSQMAVSPEELLGQDMVRAFETEAYDRAWRETEGGWAAYAPGVQNRDAVFDRARREILGQLIAEEMAKRGFETLPADGRIEGDVDFTDVDGTTRFLPTYARERVMEKSRIYTNALIDGYLSLTGRLTTAFKNLTLPMSLIWQIGDLVSIIWAAASTGVPPTVMADYVVRMTGQNYGGGLVNPTRMDIVRNVFKDPKDRRVGELAELLAASGIQDTGLRIEESRRLRGQDPGAEPQTLPQRLLNRFTPDLPRPTFAGGRLGMTTGNIGNIFPTFRKGAYRVNEAINRVGRHAYFLAKLDEELNKLNARDGTNYTIDDIAAMNLHTRPGPIRTAWEDAIDTANEVMGDWLDLTPFERKYVMPHLTFYAWTKHIHKLFVKLAKENPAAIKWQLYLGSLAYDPDADPLEMYSSYVPTVGGGLAGTNFLNSFGDIVEGPLGSLALQGDPSRLFAGTSPLPRMAFGAITGRNLAKGLEPISRQYGTGGVTKFGQSKEVPLYERPSELLGFSLQQFPLGTKVLDLLPSGQLPGTSIQTGPFERYDTGQARFKPMTSKPVPKFGGRLLTAARLLTLPGVPTTSIEKMRDIERRAQQRLRAFETAKKTAEARND